MTEILLAVLVFELIILIPLWPRIPPERPRPRELLEFRALRHGDPGPIATEIELRFQGYRRGEPIVMGQPMTIIDLSHRSRK